MRVESDKPVAKGGWVHTLSEPLPVRPAPKPVEKRPDWTCECRKMFKHSRAAQKRTDVARQLGVSVESLELLRVGIGWDSWNNMEFSSWPSRDEIGRCIGYVRRYSDGEKKTNSGGSTGVFYTRQWFRHPGPIFIVEGGSDVAACETHGLSSIGRASNVCGEEWIRKMIRRHRDRPVIVVGERDEKPEKRGGVKTCPLNCPGCAWCWPGMFGMQKFAKELAATGIMVPEPYKDMRELLRAGGKDEFLQGLVI